MNSDFKKEMLKTESSVWKKLDKMNDIEIIDLNDFEMEKKNIQKAIIEKLGRVNLEENVEYNFNLIFYRYINKRKCLILGNNTRDNKPILIKGKILKILLFLLGEFRNRGRGGFAINISNEHLELFLDQFDMTVQQFISNLERVKVDIKQNIIEFSTYEDNEKLISYDILLIENNCIKIYDINDKINILIFSNKLENDFKNSKMTQELEKKASRIHNMVRELEENVAKSKIDYIAILGIFVCVFALISANFNFLEKAIGVSTIEYFIKFEFALIISLASLVGMIRIFIYKGLNFFLSFILVFSSFFLLFLLLLFF